MGYYKIIQERDSDAGMGMRDPMEEAFREGYRKGYGEAMKYVHENGMDGGMGFRQGQGNYRSSGSGMGERMYPYFPPRGMGFRDESDPYDDMENMGERRRRDSRGRYM